MVAVSASWIRTIDAIVRGDALQIRFVRAGPTPSLLKGLGLPDADLVMSGGKIRTARREHPEVSVAVWHRLPQLVSKPLAVFPSARRDGSLVLVLVMFDAAGDPIIVPIAPGVGGAPNTILSVYGKRNGLAWATSQIAHAVADGCQVYVSKNFAASVPKPGSASKETIPSSPGPIPADGTAKSIRQILSIVKNATKS